MTSSSASRSMIELVADALLGGKHAFCKTLVVNRLARLVYNILGRTGLALGIVHFDSCNIGLPSHPPSQIQKAFCNGFQARVTEVTAGRADKKPIKICLQDKTRMGQRGMLQRILAHKGTWPRVKRHCRYAYCVLFPVACPPHICASGPTPRR